MDVQGGRSALAAPGILTRKSENFQRWSPAKDAKITCVRDDAEEGGSNEIECHETRDGPDPDGWNRRDWVGGPPRRFPDRLDSRDAGRRWPNPDAGRDPRPTGTGGSAFRLPHDRRQGALPIFRASGGRTALRD